MGLRTCHARRTCRMSLVQFCWADAVAVGDAVGSWALEACQ